LDQAEMQQVSYSKFQTLLIDYLFYSVILIPGSSLLSSGLMGVAYLLTLGYLFLGIAIVSDIFME
jgi:hypothetical protein